MNVIEESVQLLEVVLDLFLDDLLNDWSHDLQQDPLGNAKQELVIGLFDLDLQIFHVHGHIVNCDKMSTILRVGSAGSELETESLSTHEDVHDSLVGN